MLENFASIKEKIEAKLQQTNLVIGTRGVLKMQYSEDGTLFKDGIYIMYVTVQPHGLST
ncbi:MAG: hypothetical protein JKY52_19115 [Flavobacteriales bacterium]|nr:hypothetical protein [Flavobacteriales bacterium]